MGACLRGHLTLPGAGGGILQVSEGDLTGVGQVSSTLLNVELISFWVKCDLFVRGF